MQEFKLVMEKASGELEEILVPEGLSKKLQSLIRKITKILLYSLALMAS